LTFGGTHRLHIQGRRVSQTKNEQKQEARSAELSLPPVSAGFLLGLLFDLEDGGKMFMRNVGFSPNYGAMQPRRPYSSKAIKNYFFQVLQSNINSENQNSAVPVSSHCFIVSAAVNSTLIELPQDGGYYREFVNTSTKFP
jgi:hypothetical protein